MIYTRAAHFDRLRQAVDSVAGTIAKTYDLLDNLKSETTPQGVVTYNYDLASRRTSMTASGQSETDYNWDDADRLTGITQGTSSVSFGYDNADRRTSLTLPNGIVLTYGYDSDSQVNSMTWALGSTQIGDLASVYVFYPRVLGLRFSGGREALSRGQRGIRGRARRRSPNCQPQIEERSARSF
jgi:YD repeat-containing protein